ncbi:MAG: hypothetical protein M1337_00430 [Actinobacteria bacterium]|nr:hypothetical protein [Actinomycetota bacterium]
MDNYWPLRGGKLRDVTTGQIVGLQGFSSEQLGGLFWYLFSLYREFAGEPEQIDASQAMLHILEADAAAAKNVPLANRLDPGASFEEAVEAVRETLRLHKAQLEEAAKSFWKGEGS